jgi:alpha-amylase/alpha-mannosidase (GH57 family)
VSRYICIHGHFYQPPRENPWLEAVEVQDSAYPYHDWNKRISVECYAPNAASRIFDAESRIINIVSNYSRMSFNFGPTVLSWMEVNDPATYNSILESDRESIVRFSGHGSAIAQCYNHIIMPLASSDDKRIQVIWGIKDFEYRFKRKPEGMWLPETAVDLETLDIMAEQGILFTILSPHQAGRMRRSGSRQWHGNKGNRIDTRHPYYCRLPSGRKIAVFFYNGGISHDIAFGHLLDNGVDFAARLMSNFDGREEPQLVNIATDGETYGHHHKYGEMALSYAFYHIENNNDAIITVYGEFLEKFPPAHEVELRENSSWSCVHGIERWRSNCGCNGGSGPGWTQEWRSSLRGIMDWLKDNFDRLYLEQILKYTSDPLRARELYINVVLKRNPEAADEFFSVITDVQLSAGDKSAIMKLLEIERNAMLMYTSCGWFFDEISGLETVQVMLYAARAMQLAFEISGLQLEETFLKLLERAPSNYFIYTNGADVYRKLVKPVMIDTVRFGAHYAVSSLFRDYQDEDNVYCYRVIRNRYEKLENGKLKLALGMIHIRSEITLEEDDISFAVLHMGDHNIFGGVRRFMGDEPFGEMWNDIVNKFKGNDLPGTFRRIEKHFTSVNYSLWHLFRDEQRAVISRVINSAVTDLERNLRQINEANFPVVQIMKKINAPLPAVFSSIMEFILNDDIKKILLSDNPDMEGLNRLIGQMREWNLEPDINGISYSFSERLNTCMQKFSLNPEEVEILEKIVNLMNTLEPLSLKFERWSMQNIYFITGKSFYPAMKQKADEGDSDARQWVELFHRLGEHLKVRPGL